MATLKDISRRIRSVEKTQQITSAMRMVAAAKLRRAQDAIIAARPYAQAMYRTMAEIGRRQRDAEHPLLTAHESSEVLEVVVVTSDRGLCGAFNASAIKRAEVAIAEARADYSEVVVSVVGRKAGDYFRRRRTLEREWQSGVNADYAFAKTIADHLSTRYIEGTIDGCVLVYNEFVSALTQTSKADAVLPLAPDEAMAEADATSQAPPYEIEPDANSLLNVLVPNALEYTIYRALLENQAGEHAARMAAMESATRNTEELIRTLTLKYNRARQAAITKELVEIVSGAEALK
ncbi:MAG: ATP synthase F1 subunit gamma [Myxococcales bacterium]|nr:ATP synthase F1 subunit gamma [Myxococcales bacterium]